MSRPHSFLMCVSIKRVSTANMCVLVAFLVYACDYRHYITYLLAFRKSMSRAIVGKWRKRCVCDRVVVDGR